MALKIEGSNPSAHPKNEFLGALLTRRRSVMARQAKQGIYYGWLIVATVAFVSFLGQGGRSGFGLFVDIWSEELGGGRALVSLAAAIGMLANGLSLPVIGRIYDRVGARWVILLSILTLGVGSLLMSAVNSIVLLIVVYGFLMSISYGGSAGPIMSALISKWFKRRRGAAVSIQAAGLAAGGLIIVPFAAYMIELVGWRATWIVLGALLLLLALPLGWLIIRNDPKDMGLLPDGDVLPVNGQAGAGLVAQAPLETERWQDSYRSSPFWQITSAYLVCGFTTGILHVHFVPFVLDQGFSRGAAATAFGVMSAMSFMGVLAIGTISDRYGRKNLLSGVYLIRGFAYVVFLFAPDPYGVWIGGVLAGASWLASVPLTTSLTADVFGLKWLGTLTGVQMVAHQVGSAISIYLGGLLYDRFGVYDLSFALSASLLVVASVVAFSIKEKQYSVRYCPIPPAPLRSTS